MPQYLTSWQSYILNLLSNFKCDCLIYARFSEYQSLMLPIFYIGNIRDWYSENLA